MKNGFVPTLLRFWWLLVIGLGLGGVAAIASVEHIKLSVPPKLSPRAHPTYSAVAELLVNSPSSPFLRTAVTTVSQGQPRTQTVRGTTVTKTPPPVVSSQTPHTQTLVNAANLFPLLIQSDPVSAIRTRLYGPLPGTVAADAVFSSQNTFGQFRPSPIPVVSVTASSNSAHNAIKLANGTVIAFAQWMAARQKLSSVPNNDRIVVQSLSKARAASKKGGLSLTLPGILFAVVLVAFGGLAVLLDRFFPAVRVANAQVVPRVDTGSVVEPSASAAPGRSAY